MRLERYGFDGKAMFGKLFLEDYVFVTCEFPIVTENNELSCMPAGKYSLHKIDSDALIIYKISSTNINENKINESLPDVLFFDKVSEDDSDKLGNPKNIIQIYIGSELTIKNRVLCLDDQKEHASLALKILINYPRISLLITNKATN